MTEQAPGANPAATLLRQQLRRLDWTIETLLNYLADRGHTYDRAKFSNYLRPFSTPERPTKRRNRGFPNNPALIRAIVQVFVADTPQRLRWTPAEALAFAQAAGQPRAELARLADLFDDAHAFSQALRDMVGLDDLTRQQIARDALERLPIHRVPEAAELPSSRFGTALETRSSFTGRTRELKSIAYALKTTPGMRYVLVGIPGLGKTRLAIEFALRYGLYFQGGVFVIVADTIERLHRELIALGQQLAPPDTHFAALPKSDQLLVTRTTLEKLPPYLLIVDNIDAIEPDELEHLLPTYGDCRILMTSRSLRHYPRWQEDELRGLSQDDSVDLLFDAAAFPTAERQAYSTTALALARQLDWLPLALTLVGAYIHSQPDPAHALTMLLAEFDDRLLSHPVLSEVSTDTTVARRLDVLINGLLQHLDAQHPIHSAARALATIAAVFAPGQLIDRELLLDLSHVEVPHSDVVPIAYPKDALRLLRERALLTTATAAISACIVWYAAPSVNNSISALQCNVAPNGSGGGLGAIIPRALRRTSKRYNATMNCCAVSPQTP
ncbi:hypothetical protein HC891_22055 [Candidatus Gracilibacteria bacterium]|nr:hypothetical protein [Candidatus Gracilibacteria bacterium]